MGRRVKTFGVVGVIICALSAIAAASAPAALFKASEPGELIGAATSNQVFETAAGNVTCTKSELSGALLNTEATRQEFTVDYSGCTAFGFASATVSPAEYDLHANGEFDILNTITISVPLGFCSVTIIPQSELTSVSYVAESGKIKEASEITGITSKGSGGACGGESTSATYRGQALVELVGGAIEWLKAAVAEPKLIYNVDKAELKATETKGVVSKEAGEKVLLIIPEFEPKLQVELTCAVKELANAQIIGGKPGTFEGRFELGGCKVEEPGGGCQAEVESETWSGELVKILQPAAVEGEIAMLFTPKVGATLMTIKFIGCLGEAKVPVTGSVAARFKLQLEAEEQPFEFRLPRITKVLKSGRKEEEATAVGMREVLGRTVFMGGTPNLLLSPKKEPWRVF